MSICQSALFRRFVEALGYWDCRGCASEKQDFALCKCITWLYRPAEWPLNRLIPELVNHHKLLFRKDFLFSLQSVRSGQSISLTKENIGTTT